MPMVDIRVSTELSEKDEKTLCSNASKVVSEITGKGQKYILVLLDHCSGWMDGNDDPVAFVDVRGIGGLHDTVNVSLTDALCKLLQEHAGISPERVYLNFANIKGYNWGWNHKTFRR